MRVGSCVKREGISPSSTNAEKMNNGMVGFVSHFAQSPDIDSARFRSRAAPAIRSNQAKFSYTTKVTHVPGNTRTRFVPSPR